MKVKCDLNVVYGFGLFVIVYVCSITALFLVKIFPSNEEVIPPLANLLGTLLAAAPTTLTGKTPLPTTAMPGAAADNAVTDVIDSASAPPPTPPPLSPPPPPLCTDSAGGLHASSSSASASASASTPPITGTSPSAPAPTRTAASRRTTTGWLAHEPRSKSTDRLLFQHLEDCGIRVTRHRDYSTVVTPQHPQGRGGRHHQTTFANAAHNCPPNSHAAANSSNSNNSSSTSSTSSASLGSSRQAAILHRKDLPEIPDDLLVLELSCRGS